MLDGFDGVEKPAEGRRATPIERPEGGPKPSQRYNADNNSDVNWRLQSCGTLPGESRSALTGVRYTRYHAKGASAYPSIDRRICFIRWSHQSPRVDPFGAALPDVLVMQMHDLASTHTSREPQSENENADTVACILCERAALCCAPPVGLCPYTCDGVGRQRILARSSTTQRGHTLPRSTSSPCIVRSGRRESRSEQATTSPPRSVSLFEHVAEGACYGAHIVRPAPKLRSAHHRPEPGIANGIYAPRRLLPPKTSRFITHVTHRLSSPTGKIPATRHAPTVFRLVRRQRRGTP